MVEFLNAAWSVGTILQYSSHVEVLKIHSNLYLELIHNEKLCRVFSPYLDVDECYSLPCLNGAACLQGNGKFTCHCPAGYTGAVCDIGRVL